MLESTLKNIGKWIKNNELKAFSILMLVNIIPLLTTKITTSLDGPQHLYVSNIIAQLLQGNEAYEMLIKFNDLIVGYWTAHFLLAVLNFLLPWWLAEKMLIIIYYIGISYAFRYAVKSLNPSATLLYTLILPFAGNYFLILGYFNLSYSWIFLFLALGYWYRYQNIYSVKRFFILMGLLVLLFLTHAFTYAIFWFILGFYLLFSFIYELFSAGFKENFIKHLKQLSFLLAAGSVSLFLWAYYIVSIREVTSYHKIKYIEDTTLLESLLKVRVLISFHFPQELPVSYVIGGLMVLLMLITIFHLFSKKHQKKITKADIFFFISVVIILLYFLFPNSFISGNVSKRILMVFFLVFILWLSAQNYNKQVVLFSVVVIMIITAYHKKRHIEFFEKIAVGVNEVLELKDHMEENSLYVPYNYSDLWTYTHLKTVVGMEDPYVNVRTPQILGQFVIEARGEEAPLLYLGSKTERELYDHWFTSGGPDSRKEVIRYVILIEPEKFRKDKKMNKVEQELDKYYKKIYTSSRGLAELYELNSKINPE